MSRHGEKLQPLYTWRGEIGESTLAPTTRHVALALSLYMNEKTVSAFPGPARLAHDTGLHLVTVKDHLRILVKEGWLVVKSRGGLKGEQRHANVYEAHIPDPHLPGAEDYRVSSAPDALDTQVQSAPEAVTAPTGSPGLADPESCTTTNSPLNNPLNTDERPPPTTTKATRVPDPFHVTDAMAAWANEKLPGYDWDAESENFLDYWRSVPGKKGVKQDWVATWKVWMRRNARGEFAPRAQQGAFGR